MKSLPSSTSTSSLLEELRIGVRRTLPYVLSHHEAHHEDRCYVVPGTDIRVCARCSGVYSGLLLGLATAVVAPWSVYVVALLPAFALADWWLESVTGGSNEVRTLTGLLLGIAAGWGLHLVFSSFWWVSVAIFAAYGVLAGYLLRSRYSTQNISES